MATFVVVSAIATTMTTARRSWQVVDQSSVTAVARAIVMMSMANAVVVAIVFFKYDNPEVESSDQQLAYESIRSLPMP